MRPQKKVFSNRYLNYYNGELNVNNKKKTWNGLRLSHFHKLRKGQDQAVADRTGISNIIILSNILALTPPLLRSIRIVFRIPL